MKTVLLLFIIIFFQNCTNSSLQTSQGNITLKFEKKSYKFKTITIKKETIYYPPVTLYREIKKYHGYYFVQDIYQTDTNQQFHSSIKWLLDILFESKNTKLIERKGNIYMFITNIKGKKINILAFNQNKKKITFLYPLSDQDFKNIYTKLYAKEDLILLKAYTAKNEKELVYSSFSPKTQLLHPLTKTILQGKKF